MFSATSLLVLACAVAINAQSVCNSIQLGIIPTSHPVKLQPALLDPGRVDSFFTISPITECTLGVSGIQAYICDNDVAPTGQFFDFSSLKVHRNGSLQGYGTALITVYCKV